MQTSQVSNAANVLTSTSAPNKQSDANDGAEPFGKVLSREVSQRNGANEAPRNKETANTPPAQQAAKAPAKQPEAKSPSKPAETKATKEGKSSDKAQADEETTDSTSTLPEELLSLVANLNELNTQAAPATDAQTLQTPPVMQDNQPAITAAAVSAAADATQVDPAVQLPTAAAAIGTMTYASPLATAGAAIKQDTGALQSRQSDKSAKVDLPLAAANNAVAAEELSAQASLKSAGAKAQDFSAAMSESLNGVTNGMQPVQQAGLHALQQQVANTAEKLTPRVGTPAWDQALGQKVVWMVAGDQQSASLTLNPPDLGPLQVVLNVSNSQANATFIAAQPEVRQALEAALPKLRDMLGEAGIQLGQASVNSGTPNQQGGFEQQGSQTARGHGHHGNRDVASNDAQVRVSRVQPASSGLGLVDIVV